MTVPIDTEHTNMTTVRLDLRSAGGWTTFGALRAFVAECEAQGATDDAPAVVANCGSSVLGGNVYQPIIGVTIDHRRQP